MSNKTNICAIMQPTYLPWLGYFDLINQSNDFIFLDNVKFNKSSYHHQNKILGVNGQITLSVPTFALKGRMETVINQVIIDVASNWKKKHLESIKQSYSKTPYFDIIYPRIESLILGNIHNLSELNIKLIKLFASMLLLDTNFHEASKMENLAEDKIQRLIDYCKIIQCDTYYSPAGSLYLNTTEIKKKFSYAKIKVNIQQFRVNPYPQKLDSFVPYMSIIDTLMCCGLDGTRDIIEKGSHYKELY